MRVFRCVGAASPLLLNRVRCRLSHGRATTCFWDRHCRILVRMADTLDSWAARYEEGYIGADRSSTRVSNRLVLDHGWPSPDAALKQWSERGDFELPGVTRYKNGKQQVHDVRNRTEFAELGVTQIWRRITFEPVARAAEGRNRRLLSRANLVRTNCQVRTTAIPGILRLAFQRGSPTYFGQAKGILSEAGSLGLKDGRLLSSNATTKSVEVEDSPPVPRFGALRKRVARLASTVGPSPEASSAGRPKGEEILGMRVEPAEDARLLRNSRVQVWLFTALTVVAFGGGFALLIVPTFAGLYVVHPIGLLARGTFDYLDALFLVMWAWTFQSLSMNDGLHYQLQLRKAHPSRSRASDVGGFVGFSIVAILWGVLAVHTVFAARAVDPAYVNRLPPGVPADSLQHGVVEVTTTYFVSCRPRARPQRDRTSVQPDRLQRIRAIRRQDPAHPAPVTSKACSVTPGRCPEWRQARRRTGATCPN